MQEQTGTSTQSSPNKLLKKQSHSSTTLRKCTAVLLLKKLEPQVKLQKIPKRICERRLTNLIHSDERKKRDSNAEIYESHNRLLRRFASRFFAPCSRPVDRSSIV